MLSLSFLPTDALCPPPFYSILAVTVRGLALRRGGDRGVLLFQFLLELFPIAG